MHEIEIDNTADKGMAGEPGIEVSQVIVAQIAEGNRLIVLQEEARDIANTAAHFEDFTLTPRPDGIVHPTIKAVGFRNRVEHFQALAVDLLKRKSFLRCSHNQREKTLYFMMQ